MRCLLPWPNATVTTRLVGYSIFLAGHFFADRRYWGHDFDLFGVTWRHRSRDRSTPHGGFPMVTRLAGTQNLDQYFKSLNWQHRNT